MGTNNNLKIFSSNPLKLKEYLDKIVRVKTIGNKIFEGTVYTIDPVSETIILVRKQEDDIISAEFVFGHAIIEIECLGESIFIPKFFEERINTEVLPDLCKKRENLKCWLNENMIPIEEYEDKLILGDIVTILPPYNIENCICTNDIILGNIQKLITSMPLQFD